MVNDPISNLIIALKNASSVGKEKVSVPATKMTLSILEVLKKNSYLEDFELEGTAPKQTVHIKVKYEDGNPAVHGVKRVSKFSQRVYRGFKKINLFKNGYGKMILSTPKGIMTDKQAMDQKIGGEVLFKIW